MAEWSKALDLVMCKSLGQALYQHCASVHPAVMGTRWNERTILCEWLQLQKMRCTLPREMRLYKSEFQYLGEMCKVH